MRISRGGRKRERRTTAEAAWLDVASLNLRRDALGAISITWKAGVPGLFLFKTEAETGFGLLFRGGWGQQRISLATTAQPIGGRRWWFVCPRSGRRARKLYLPPGADRFASREAHGLIYESSRDNDDLDRSWRRACRARAKLGPGDLVDTPVRPAGMRPAKFEALAQQFRRAHIEHMIKVDDAIDQMLKREARALERLDDRAAARGARQFNAHVRGSGAPQKT